MRVVKKQPETDTPSQDETTNGPAATQPAHLQEDQQSSEEESLQVPEGPEEVSTMPEDPPTEEHSEEPLKPSPAAHEQTDLQSIAQHTDPPSDAQLADSPSDAQPTDSPSDAQPTDSPSDGQPTDVEVEYM